MSKRQARTGGKLRGELVSILCMQDVLCVRGLREGDGVWVTYSVRGGAMVAVAVAEDA